MRYMSTGMPPGMVPEEPGMNEITKKKLACVWIHVIAVFFLLYFMDFKMTFSSHDASGVS